MTTLRDLHIGNETDKLHPRVTQALGSKKYAVGLFYERDGIWYSFQVPGYQEAKNWHKKAEKAIEAWSKICPPKHKGKEVINSYE